MKLRCGIVAVMLMISLPPVRAAQTPEPAASLLFHFDNDHDYAAKERLLLTLTNQDSDAGPALLQLAQATTHVDTRWLAMRGMATLHYAACAPFLEASLKVSNALVRANAARALSDLRITDASAALLVIFADEKEQPVVEQGSHVLRVLGVRAAAPYLEIQALGFLGDSSDVPLLAAYYLGGMRCETVVSDAIGELAGVNSAHPAKWVLLAAPRPRQSRRAPGGRPQKTPGYEKIKRPASGPPQS